MRVPFHHGWTVVAALASIALVGCHTGEQEVGLLSPSSRSADGALADQEASASWSSFDDALLNLRLRLALLEQIGVPALGVQVDVANGTARLSGRAPSELAASRVVEVAVRTPGVTSVESEIEPTPDAAAAVGPLEEAEQRLADALLVARTRIALVRELGRGAFDLIVEAADNHLILRGTMPDRQNLERALSAANQVEGAEEIHALLTLDL